MRIVGGRWRGRTLRAPEGRGTRPTTDRTREQMASMLLSAFDLDLTDVRVLDAFAGSGGIGLELLSRGAAWCTFVERDRRAASVLRDNVRQLASEREAAVQVGDVIQLAARAGLRGGPFDLVLLDPPYAMGAGEVAGLLADLRAGEALAGEAVILYEHASGSEEPSLEGLEPLRRKEGGTTALSLLRLRGESA